MEDTIQLYTPASDNYTSSYLLLYKSKKRWRAAVSGSTLQPKHPSHCYAILRYFSRGARVTFELCVGFFPFALYFALYLRVHPLQLRKRPFHGCSSDPSKLQYIICMIYIHTHTHTHHARLTGQSPTISRVTCSTGAHQKTPPSSHFASIYT